MLIQRGTGGKAGIAVLRMGAAPTRHGCGPKVTAKNCLRPCAILDWRASCRSASHRFTARVGRNPGSKSKIRRLPR